LDPVENWRVINKKSGSERKAKEKRRGAGGGVALKAKE